MQPDEGTTLMQVKTCPATIKAAGPQDGLEEGVVEAIVATYDVDSIGDQIMPGAFAETLAEWKSSNDPIPFIWSHKSDDPDAHIGVIEEAEERPGVGLWVKARIDMDEPPARRVYKLLKGRRVRQYSFAYDELDARPPGEKSAPGARKELHRLKVYEAGPTPIGCNQNTSTLDVKNQPVTVNVNNAPAPAAEPGEKSTTAETAAKISDTATDLKAGRILSKQNENRVAEIARLAQELLASVQKADEDPSTDSNAEKATPTAEPAAAPAPEAKSSEPAQHGTASERLRIELDLLEVELDSFTL